MKIVTLLESNFLFSDFHYIKLDPDRSGLHDVVKQLMPLIIKMAYKDLWNDKQEHEQKYGPESNDEDAYNFEFTEDALVDKVEDLLLSLAELLSEVHSADIRAEIKRASSDFKYELK